jgi:hypothetical protein
MRKNNVDIIAFRLPATVSVEFNLRKKGERKILAKDEHIPASNGTDTTGLHGVKVIHDCGVDGFNFFARYAKRALVQRHWRESWQGIRTSA